MMLAIEVCYALPEGESAFCALALAEGATVREAIEASGLLGRFPEIDLDVQVRVGNLQDGSIQAVFNRGCAREPR